MAEYGSLVAEEITATLDRAGFETLSPEVLHVEITTTLQRKLGDCRPVHRSDGEGDAAQYQIRIARRLFDDACDTDWRDTVRHEVAHAYVFSTVGQDVQPHGDEWKEAARRAGANPTARYDVSDDRIDADYVLACPDDCFERGYLKRSKRIKFPWKYACGECETRLVSYDAAETPAALDPGTCYVTSIPWETTDDRSDAATAQTAPYLLACPNGCTAWPYQQRTKRIQNPWLYTCPECDTTLISCDGGDTPSRYDPGTCHVESIPWIEPRLVHACPNGCFSVGYGQHRDETRHPDQYRCGDCDTRTVSYPADQRPSDPTPGTTYTD
jgi:predicted SprT family Zn-dependent metalloprotease